jgi:A/G-specific adenine glycosylase
MALSDRDGAAAAGTLLRWYARERRDLPWRRKSDPYRVLVSEIMLQQTTVETAIPYFERFISAFPSVSALGRAREEEILAIWSGLGYYRRARALLAAARIIVEKHAGVVPDDLAALRALPGVGPYTASAVLAMAYGRREVALDGNLRRVLARLVAFEGDPRSREGEALLMAAGRRLVAAADPSALNQALMDLGATICTPRSPRCGECPMSRRCDAKRLGLQEAIPPARARKAAVNVGLAACVLRRGRQILLRRRSGGLMDGMWEFPMAEAGGEVTAAEAIAGEILRRHGIRVGELRPVGEIRHTITHHRLRIQVFEARTRSSAIRRSALPSVAEPGGALGRWPAGAPGRGPTRWVAEGRIPSLPLTGIARKILRASGLGAAARGARGTIRRPGSGTASSDRSAPSAPAGRPG